MSTRRNLFIATSPLFCDLLFCDVRSAAVGAGLEVWEDRGNT
jgi:hypothetical protein